MCDLPVDTAVASAAVLSAHAGPAYTTPFSLFPHRILGHGEESRMLVFSLDVLAQRRHRVCSPGSEEHFGILVLQGELVYVWCRRGEPVVRLVHAGKSSVLQLGTGGCWCRRDSKWYRKVTKEQKGPYSQWWGCKSEGFREWKEKWAGKQQSRGRCCYCERNVMLILIHLYEQASCGRRRWRSSLCTPVRGTGLTSAASQEPFQFRTSPATGGLQDKRKE